MISIFSIFISGKVQLPYLCDTIYNKKLTLVFSLHNQRTMALPENLAKKMQTFQANNNLPVFLKGGPADKMLYGITMGLCGVGLLGIVKLLYDLGFKKKQG
ncbi:cytochrome c oxidase subunit 7A-like 2 isoform 2-T2 [Glossina fuscipes fuscipes]